MIDKSRIQSAHSRQRQAVGKKPKTIIYYFKSTIFRRMLRSYFAGFSIVSLLSIIAYVLYVIYFESGPDFMFKSIPFNEITKAGIDIRIDTAKNLFQIGVLLIGGIWGLIIAKKGEAVLLFKDYPELIMSLCANVLFILSFFYHAKYLNRITDIYIDAGIVAGKNDDATIPDVFALNINYLFVAQAAFLVAGTLISFLIFISAHKLK